MNKSIGCWFGALGLTLAGGNAFALSVTGSSNAEALANLILGSGITISNASFTGTTVSAGSFSGGLAAGIGIEQGLILTSGDINIAPGPNDDSGAGADFYEQLGYQGPGDSDLDAIVGADTYDATVLEFDFVSDGGNLFFNYAFASEEYDEFVGSPFNDVFAFLLDGINIALIPGTSTAVAINTINNGNGFDPMSVPSNPELFVDNTGATFDIQYDGFTTVLVARALNLSPGTHHIKLAVADTSDEILDSAVFIGGGTFSDTIVPVPPAMLLFGSALGLLGWVRRRAA